MTRWVDSDRRAPISRPAEGVRHRAAPEGTSRVRVLVSPTSRESAARAAGRCSVDAEQASTGLNEACRVRLTTCP
jgi:hypothetical protein